MTTTVAPAASAPYYVGQLSPASKSAFDRIFSLALPLALLFGSTLLLIVPWLGIDTFNRTFSSTLSILGIAFVFLLLRIRKMEQQADIGNSVINVTIDDSKITLHSAARGQTTEVALSAIKGWRVQRAPNATGLTPVSLEMQIGPPVFVLSENPDAFGAAIDVARAASSGDNGPIGPRREPIVLEDRLQTALQKSVSGRVSMSAGFSVVSTVGLLLLASQIGSLNIWMIVLFVAPAIGAFGLTLLFQGDVNRFAQTDPRVVLTPDTIYMESHGGDYITWIELSSIRSWSVERKIWTKVLSLDLGPGPVPKYTISDPEGFGRKIAELQAQLAA